MYVYIYVYPYIHTYIHARIISHILRQHTVDEPLLSINLLDTLGKFETSKFSKEASKLGGEVLRPENTRFHWRCCYLQCCRKS